MPNAAAKQMRTNLFRSIVFAVFALCLCRPALAGQTCTEAAITPGELRSALALGSRVRDTLNASGAKVALIGRIGADLGEYGLRYSHVGFVQRDDITGRWRVVHLLNRCGTAESALFEEGLGAFFLDHPKQYEAILLLPTPAEQARIAAVLSRHAADTLYDPHYNMIANAHATRFQNSNQWVLESLAMALAADGTVATREDAQRFLYSAGYRPGVLHIGLGKRLGARMFAANVSFSDHPIDALANSSFEVVTVESVLSFMKRIDPASTQQVVRLTGNNRVIN